MRLECFAIYPTAPEIVAARPERPWMDAVAGRVPYRCLPLTVANASGWEILCPAGFTAEWDGGEGTDALTVTPDDPGATGLGFSHFGNGTLTFHTGYVFRTPPGFSVHASGPPNSPKHGLAPLSGLVETDWLPFPFTMNWLFTAPGKVRFEQGEPFCFLTVIETRQIDAVEPVIRRLADEPELQSQYEAWSASRAQFNAALMARDPETLRQSWQKHYFTGRPPENGGVCPVDHVHRRRLSEPSLG